MHMWTLAHTHTNTHTHTQLLFLSEFTETVETVSVCTRQHTSAYVSIRQHTSAYVSIRQLVSVHTHKSAHFLLAKKFRSRVTELSNALTYAHVC